MSLDYRSETKLAGVHPALVGVVRRAREIMEDRDDGLAFVVTEGLRTVERQAQLVRVGASRTMDSKHITGNAADLMATIDGRGAWDWPLYFHVAAAMQTAAREQGVQIVWGGVWDKPLTAYASPEDECHAYVERRRAEGVRRPFIDGPHFELAAQTHSA